MRSRVLAVLVVMVVVSLLAPVYAGTLAVPLIGQEEPNWCWDASSNMILKYYGFTHTQTEVADWAVGGYNVGNHLSGTTIGPLAAPGSPSPGTYNRKGCGLVLKQFGPVDSSYLDRALTMDEVSEEIDGKRPAMIAVRLIKAGTDVGGHAIVLRGYDESVDEIISLNDPWPADDNVHGPGTVGASYMLVAYDDMVTAAGTYSDASAVIGNRWAQTLKTGRSLDLCFLIDTTGSMGDDIASVQAASLSMIDYLVVNYKDLRLAVVDYRDNPACETCDAASTDYITNVDTVFTTDANVAKAAISGLTLGDGGDLPEAVFSALVRTMSGSEIGAWRKDAERHIILMGDAPGHDPEPWDGGYSYADVLAIWAAETNKISVDALLPAAGSTYSEEAGSQFSGIAGATGGTMRTTADSNAGVAMLEIVDEITTTPRSPHGSVAAFRPVFTFTPPTESMGPLVKNVLLEIQKWNVNAKSPEKSAWKKFMLLKLAADATSWTPLKPLPKGDYQWRTGYVRGAGTFTLPSLVTQKIAAATLMEPNWIAFTRAEVVPAIPTMITPSYSSFVPSDKEQSFTFSTVAGADSYALGIFVWKESKTGGAWKVWKKLTIKPKTADLTAGQITVTVKGLTLNASYEWSVQALNFDHPKPVWTP